MMAFDIATVFDLILLAALVAMMVYLVRLNRRLTDLRHGREEMGAVVRDFTAATARAERGLAALKEVAAVAGAALQEEIDHARSLRDELAFLAEKAETTAERLARVPSNAREAKQPGAAAPVSDDTRIEEVGTDTSAKADVRRALASVR
jgi:hypothetical protein